MSNTSNTTVANPSRPSNRVSRGARLARKAWRRVRPIVLLIAPLPIAMVVYLQQDEPVGRILLAVACIIVAIAAASWWKSEWLTTHRRNVIAMLLIVPLSLIAITVHWNNEYRRYTYELPKDQRHEVFRARLQRYTTPVYGVPHSPTPKTALPAIAVAILATFLLVRGKFDRPLSWPRLAFIILIQLATIEAFALADDLSRSAENAQTKERAASLATEPSLPRVTGQSPQLNTFRKDAALFDSIDDICKRYVSMMPKLSWFGQHYPPGSAMLYRIEADHNLPYLVITLLLLSTAASTVFIYLGAKQLSTNPMVHHLSVLCYATACGPLTYTTFSTTALALLPAAVAFWALLKTCKSGSIPHAVLLGVVLILFAVLSFSVVFLCWAMGLLILLACWYKIMPWRNAIVAGIVTAITGVVCMWLLNRLTGLDLLACAQKGVELHHLQSGNNGFDSRGNWFMRSTGNLLAFLMANSPLIALLFTSLVMWKRSDFRTLERLPGLVMPIILVACAFSGKFYFETERIWVFFIPLIAMAGAAELSRYSDYRGRWDARVILIMMIVFATAVELAFQHYV